MLTFILLFSFMNNNQINPCDLYGKVKFVSSHADYKVRIVNHHGRLRVKYMKNFADDPGEWQPVIFGEKFRVQIVRSGEDFTIQKVDNFPGCHNEITNNKTCSIRR